MQLYSAASSPFVRKVHVCLLELGMADQVEVVNAAGTPLDASNMPTSQNPLGKIPCLTRPDGPALYDSRVITRYLDDRAGGKLYPATPRLWETLTLEAAADGIMDAAILMVYEKRVRPENMVFDKWVDGQWAKITRAIEAIEDRWMSHLAGPLDLAQIGVACALEYLDLRHSDRDWRKGHGVLADWQAEFAKRSAMQATQPHV